MSGETQRTIRIKWVRSTIGFPRSQRELIRGLGLRHLNHVVVRPDTAQIRGLVANIPHLVEVIGPPASPVWASVAEYAVLPAEPAAGSASAPPPPAPATVIPVVADEDRGKSSERPSQDSLETPTRAAAESSAPAGVEVEESRRRTGKGKPTQEVTPAPRTKSLRARTGKAPKKEAK